jgi:hypothetical protein
VFIAATCIDGMPPRRPAGRRAPGAFWRRRSRSSWPATVGGCEQAFGYQRFVLQFFLLAGLTGKRAGADFSTAYWQRLEAGFDFMAALMEAGPAPALRRLR